MAKDKDGKDKPAGGGGSGGGGSGGFGVPPGESGGYYEEDGTVVVWWTNNWLGGFEPDGDHVFDPDHRPPPPPPPPKWPPGLPRLPGGAVEHPNCEVLRRLVSQEIARLDEKYKELFKFRDGDDEYSVLMLELLTLEIEMIRDNIERNLKKMRELDCGGVGLLQQDYDHVMDSPAIEGHLQHDGNVAINWPPFGGRP